MTSFMGTQKNRGFTLIELLIAMSLTVLIGVISYRFLDTSIRVQEQGDAAQQSLAALEQTWQLLASDLQNSIDRPVTKPAIGSDLLSAFSSADDAAGMRRPSMMSAQFADLSLTQLLSVDGGQLWFSRQAWVNPLGQARSEIQRVLYRLDENGRLFRDYWPERNQDLSAAPEGSLLLLENVQSFRIVFLPQGQHPLNSVWSAQWPPAIAPDASDQTGSDTDEKTTVPRKHLPAAVRISLTLYSGDASAQAEPGRAGATGNVIERTFVVSGF